MITKAMQQWTKLSVQQMKSTLENDLSFPAALENVRIDVISATGAMIEFSPPSPELRAPGPVIVKYKGLPVISFFDA